MDKYVFLTNELIENESWNGTCVEVVKDVAGSDTVEVRFFDNTVKAVERSNLFDPDKVPFKVGDEVKNLHYFEIYNGSMAWPGIRWEVKRVTYTLPNLAIAVLVCDSTEVALWNKIFMSDQVEKA